MRGRGGILVQPQGQVKAETASAPLTAFYINALPIRRIDSFIPGLERHKFHL